MTTITLVLVIVCVAGLVLLAFGYAALVTLIKELQDRLDEVVPGDRQRRVDRFAGDRPSFVLVIEPTCMSCEERVADLVEYVRRDHEVTPLSIMVLQAASGSRPPALPSDVEIDFVSDATLVGELGVGIVPLGLVFEPNGTETGRSVLGDRSSFDRMIAWASTRDQPDVQRVGGGTT